MNAPGTDSTVYLRAGGAEVYAVLHPVEDGARRSIGVLFCPPFGWDEVCSYRGRREWAQRLATAGYPSLRPSYPSTGDSAGSPRDPGRLEAWTDAVGAAAAWLRETSGVQRTVAVGMGLGGMLAHRAAAAGAPIDDLVLWGTPARGRAWIRELTAFSKLEMSSFFGGLEAPPALADGELEAGGFLLSAETVRAMTALDLTEMPLPDPQRRRILLLDRDGIAVDHRLAAALEQSGASVEIGAGVGYAAMTSHPQQAQAPVSVIERVEAWLDATPPTKPSSDQRAPAVSTSETARLTVDGAAIIETPIAVAQRSGRLAGILAEPAGASSGLCAVLLNAGAVRRIGPNRMWVEAARRWAARGIPTLRLDVEGLGDADGDPSPYVSDAGLYVPHLVPQVLAALDELERRGTGQRFVLGGLCAGAYWSLHAALEDPRVLAALLLNPRALVWDPALLPSRDFRALISKPLSWAKIREQASGPRVRALGRWMLASPKRSLASLGRTPGTEQRVGVILDRLAAGAKRTLFVFAENEPLRDELVSSGQLGRLEQMPNVSIEYIAVRDHTLRPCRIQQRAHELLDRAMDRELDAQNQLGQGLTQIAASE